MGGGSSAKVQGHKRRAEGIQLLTAEVVHVRLDPFDVDKRRQRHELEAGEAWDGRHGVGAESSDTIGDGVSWRKRRWAGGGAHTTTLP